MKLNEPQGVAESGGIFNKSDISHHSFFLKNKNKKKEEKNAL